MFLKHLTTMFITTSSCVEKKKKKKCLKQLINFLFFTEVSFFHTSLKFQKEDLIKRVFFIDSWRYFFVADDEMRIFTDLFINISSLVPTIDLINKKKKIIVLVNYRVCNNQDFI